MVTLGLTHLFYAVLKYSYYYLSIHLHNVSGLYARIILFDTNKICANM